jgi:gliding motility-associated-like protein
MEMQPELTFSLTKENEIDNIKSIQEADDMRRKKSMKILYSSVLFLLLTGPSLLLAQDLRQHNWYFGNSTRAIRFNRGTNAAQSINNQALPFRQGGAAVATDPATANLLFYTDGVQVYDANHLPMPNGNGLNGQPDANQPVVITPIPAQANKYYIFTNSSNYTTGGSISRSIVDLNQFGNAVFPAPATGVVEVAKNVAVGGLTSRSEGMIVVPHQNKTDFWLITHLNGSQSYSATLIDAAATFITTTTSPIGLPISVANFAYHSKSKKIAVSPQDPNTDALILNFDDATGIFSFDKYIFNSATASTTNQSIYDIEWDTKGQYLYLSRHGDTGITADVLQYDYLNPSVSLTSVLRSPIFRSYGLQNAPDSAMYHLYQAVPGGPFLVGKFTKTDTVASEVINTQSLFSAAQFNGTQFPSFTPKENVTIAVNFTANIACQNSATAFFPTVTPNADSLRWDFGDGNTSRGWSPIHTYESAGNFNAKLIAFYRGQKDSVTVPITIKPFALQLQLAQDTTACSCELPFPKDKTAVPCNPKFSVPLKIQEGTASSIVWSNGDTGNTLTPDSVGYYYVVVTDASGCSAYAGVNVKEYGIPDQRANVWYFGNKAGIDFNPLFNIPASPAKALSNSIMDAPEGCATISDRNGQLIFYTDGDKVFDKTHTQIDSGIGGDPTSSQSAIIIPVPGDETLYYIFTTQAVSGTSKYELRYSLFDLKLNTGKGALIQKNILLFAKSTERVTANAQWLIAHEYGNNTFRAYQITAQGIGEPVYSEIGSDHSFNVPAQGEGYMKLGPNNILAVTLSTPGTSNLIELFQFDNSTGRLSDYKKIDLKEPNGQVYGVEFSPGGNKLFATVKGTPSPSVLFEYFLDSLNQPYLKQRISQNGEFGALALGPDGQIYMAVNGNSSLGTIQAVDDTTRLSAFNLNGFNLAAGTNSRLGLPNFIQIQGSGFGGPGFSFAGLCVGDSTRFTGTPTDIIDEFQWSFGDGASSTEASPVHLYAAPGTYTVSMRLYNRCKLDTTIIQKVTIFSPPPKPTLPGAIALCTGAVTLDANNTNIPGLTYLWSSGDTLKTLTLNQPAFVSVTNTDTNGCFSTAQSIVADNRPQLDLGLDLTVCEDNATPVLNAQNPGAIYLWKINGVNASTIQTQAVDTSLPGIFTYEVTVTDPVTTCFVTDQKVYTINVSPSFTLTGTNPTSCGTATGSITLQLNTSTPAGGPYSYFISGPSFNNQGIDQVAPGSIPFTGRLSGTYSAIVQDQISGCTLSSSFGLTDNVITSVTPTVVDGCAVTYSVAVVGGTAPYRFTFTNSGTGEITGPSAPTTSPFISPALSAGSYVLEVRDAGNCVFISPTPLIVNPNPANTLLVNQSDLCDATPTLTASGSGTSYSWTSSITNGIIGSTAGPTIQLQTGLGNVTYTVTSTGGTGCPATQATTVNVANFTTPTLSQSTECADQVIMTAQPAGNFTYRWYKDGVFQGTLGGQQIALSTVDHGAKYKVELINTLNGCITTSAELTAKVTGTISATVISTPPCDDNKPFTLTASAIANDLTGVTYAWFFNGSALSSATSATTSQINEGTYRIDVRKGTCLAQAQIEIRKGPLPIGELLDRVIICNDPENSDPSTSSVNLDPGPFELYNWFKNQLTLNYTVRVLNADSEGTYEVDITNSFGCVSRDKTIVKNECLPKIVAPNAFRPTSSQVANKEFSIFSFFITDNFHVFIYNRWGELVFESTDRNFKWNGGYNNNAGQPLPGGTYAYVVKYESAFRPDKGVQEKRGGVSLIR